MRPIARTAPLLFALAAAAATAMAPARARADDSSQFES